MKATLYRVGMTGRGGRGGLRHAMERDMGSALCGAHTFSLPFGAFDLNHPRACPRCRKEVRDRA